MIIVDTNVLSELMRPIPDPRIVRWFDELAASSLWMTAITALELIEGSIGMPDGRAKTRVTAHIDRVLRGYFRDRVLAFDMEAAEATAILASNRRRRGISIDFRDTQIAGIAIARKAILATRNLKDFQDLPVEVVNPWIPAP